jgi:hypothetical protein
METVGRLPSLGSAKCRGGSTFASAIPAHDLKIRMLSHPGSGGFYPLIWQKVDDSMAF